MSPTAFASTARLEPLEPRLLLDGAMEVGGIADFDDNGVLNGLDIPAFKAALADADAWAGAHPDRPHPDVLGDFDGNGAFNGLDIPGFKEALGEAEASSAAEPTTTGESVAASALVGDAVSDWQWAPHVPSSGQVTLTVHTDRRPVTAGATIVFYDSAFRIADWGAPVRTGATIEIPARVERWTGISVPVLWGDSHTYLLPELEPGTYTVEWSSWGTPVTSIEFTVGGEALGDFDGAGMVDELDVPAFKEALADPSTWAETHGRNPHALGDYDGNGVFNGLDIPGFRMAMEG